MGNVLLSSNILSTPAECLKGNCQVCCSKRPTEQCSKTKLVTLHMVVLILEFLNGQNKYFLFGLKDKHVSKFSHIQAFFHRARFYFAQYVYQGFVLYESNETSYSILGFTLSL